VQNGKDEMGYPAFFDKIPPIRLYDPLAEFLGTFKNGTVEIGYRECALFAGHSCPTVAGAYMMTRLGLEILYGSRKLPQRSGIEICLKKKKDDGVTGVTGSVAAYICGAGDEGGFPGIAGAFSRKNLLHYGCSEMKGDLRLKRTDTGAYVELAVDATAVPGSPEIKSLMKKCISADASDDERAHFEKLWQNRVEKMLTDPETTKPVVSVICQKN